MAGELPHPEYIATEVASVFEGAMYMTASLGEMDMPTLAQVHAIAARDMVEQGRFVALSGAAAENPDQSVVGNVEHRWQSYAMAMFAVEQAVDARNPEVQPPLSQKLRGIARVKHGEDLDTFTPTSFVLGPLVGKPETPQA